MKSDPSRTYELNSCRRLHRLSLVLMFFASACSTPAPKPVATVLAPAEQADDSLAEHARIRESNRVLPAFTSEELHKLIVEPANSSTLKQWRDTRSYYALLEIVEGIVEPEIGRLRRRDIQELLGKGDPDYPNSNGRVLHYAGDRRIPVALHLLIEFDEMDIVKDLYWVSE